jgi:hypothetical protein
LPELCDKLKKELKWNNKNLNNNLFYIL